jgi:hypothetical protein
MSSIYGFLRFQKFSKMHPSASQKTVPIIFLADGIGFGFFVVGES